MVSDFALGSIITGTFTAAGTLGASYIALKRSEMVQEERDKRIIGQEFASKEADLMIELSYQLNRSYRKYRVGVRHAAIRAVSEEKYFEEYEDLLFEFQETVDQACVFLSDYGEAHLSRYISHLFDAQGYIAEHSQPEEELDEPRKGDVQALLSEDDADLQWNEWEKDYREAKWALGQLTSNRLQMLSPLVES